MKNKKFTLLSILVLLLLVSGYCYIIPIFSSSEKNLQNELAERTVSSNDLINAYTINEEKSDRLYTGKIIEVSGFIKEISFLNNRNTIILNSNTETFGVICDINPTQTEKIKLLKKHQKISVKGICKGFLKDVILLNCSIDLIPNE
jgi:ABC-type lipoprotein release transport system permease subunit